MRNQSLHTQGTLLTIPPAVLYIIVSISFGYYIDRQSKIPKPVFMIAAQIAIIGEYGCIVDGLYGQELTDRLLRWIDIMYEYCWSIRSLNGMSLFNY